MRRINFVLSNIFRDKICMKFLLNYLTFLLESFCYFSSKINLIFEIALYSFSTKSKFSKKEILCILFLFALERNISAGRNKAVLREDIFNQLCPRKINQNNKVVGKDVYLYRKAYFHAYVNEYLQ